MDEFGGKKKNKNPETNTGFTWKLSRNYFELLIYKIYYPITP
jgi:hypothetical protein